jgi:hypothetical protein
MPRFLATSRGGAPLVKSVLADSILLSVICRLLSRYLASGNDKALDLLRRISPAAWQHLHFLGHYAFRDKRHPIDLDVILAGIDDL